MEINNLSIVIYKLGKEVSFYGKARTHLECMTRKKFMEIVKMFIQVVNMFIQISKLKRREMPLRQPLSGAVSSAVRVLVSHLSG